MDVEPLRTGARPLGFWVQDTNDCSPKLRNGDLQLKKVKVRIALYGLETHHKATERHPPYGITHCYLLPDTGERAP